MARSSNFTHSAASSCASRPSPASAIHAKKILGEPNLQRLAQGRTERCHHLWLGEPAQWQIEDLDSQVLETATNRAAARAWYAAGSAGLTPRREARRSAGRVRGPGSIPLNPCLPGAASSKCHTATHPGDAGTPGCNCSNTSLCLSPCKWGPL